MADQKKKLVAVVAPSKPISQMSEKERRELARSLRGRTREQVPAPKRSPSASTVAAVTVS